MKSPRPQPEQQPLFVPDDEPPPVVKPETPPPPKEDEGQWLTSVMVDYFSGGKNW